MDNMASGWFIGCTDQSGDLFPGYRNVQITFKGQYCSMITRIVATWSMHGLSFRKPACSSRNSLSTSVFVLSRRILLNTFPGIDSKVMPLQFV